MKIKRGVIKMKKTILMVLMLVLSLTSLSAQQIELTPVKFDEVDAGMPYNVKQVPVTDPQSMKGIKIALVAAHGFEEVEATYPLTYFLSRGAEIDIITPDWIKDRVMEVQFLKPSVWLPVTKTISQAKVSDYCAVLIPGGAWNPIIMRTDEKILNFIKAAKKANKLIAAICHGPQVLISAKLVKGKEVTGVGDIRTDLANAGARVINDMPVVIDGNILTSRDPNDLAEFSQAIEQYLKKNLSFCKSQKLIEDESHSTTNSHSREICPHCKGKGKLYGGPGMYPYKCPTCNGKGYVHSNKPPMSTDH
jgi:protease I